MTSMAQKNCDTLYMILKKRLFCFSLSLLLQWPVLNAREIAITFDDAPRPDTRFFTAEERNQKLLQALTEQDVKALFFITTRHINNSNKSRLKLYTEHGHLLANHSHQHLSANTIDAKDYLADVTKAHKILNDFPGYVPFFRYPMLHEGNSIEKRDIIRKGLSELNLANGYVTIDNYDWYLDSLLQQAVKQKRDIHLEVWEEYYIQHLLSSIQFYDAIANEYLNRSPKHVLLLHENDLAALFVGKLIDRLKKDGWKIIDPVEAYQDPIAQITPETLFNNQGRVAAIAETKGAQRKKLVQNSEDDVYLKARAVELKLVSEE